MSLVDDFLDQAALAVAGVSRFERGYGYQVWKHLQSKGIRVYAINPKADMIGGQPAYPSVKQLPEPVGGVITVVPPERTLRVVEDCVEAGVPRVWMQPGSESEEAIELAEEKGLEVSAHQCMLLV